MMMDSQSIFVQLRNILAELYPDVASARRVGDDAGIDLGQINFQTGAINFWHAILAEALRTGKGDVLLNVVLDEYPAHSKLRKAYDAYVGAGKRLIPPPPPGTSKEEQRAYQNRQAMIKLVYDIWVKGVLEKSLYNQLLIDLDMEQHPEAVERPWGMVLETPAHDSRLLPAGTKIATVFAEVNQSLLILGEPGSGKSTTLYELARDLLNQAAQNPALPIPVLFNLSSWAEKRQPFRQWLVDELREKYQIPKALAQMWVEKDELLLLLDGLDEVKQARREECVKTINEFQQSCKMLVPLALCSRRAEYEVLTGKLKLSGAIILHPLTSQQINSFLTRAGDRLGVVVYLLQTDNNIQALAQSPLTFGILCLTYQDKIMTDIKLGNGIKTHLQQLFDAYIIRMLQRPGKLTIDRYSRIQTLYWLTWLATKMVQYEQTEFLIERLQPSWGQSRGQRSLPVRLIMLLWGPLYGVIYGLIYGLSIELIYGLVDWLIFGRQVGLSFGLSDRLIYGVIYGFIGGLSVGFIGGLSDWLSGGIRRIRPNEQPSILLERLWSSLYSGLFCWLSVGLSIGLLDWLSGGSVLASGNKLFSILLSSMFGGMLGVLFGGFKPVKLGVWRSWKRLKSTLMYGLISGLFVSLLIGLLAGFYGGLLYWLGVGSILGLLGGLLFEPTTSLDKLSIIMTQLPNQGIKQVSKISLTIGMFGGLIFGLLGGLSLGLIEGLELGVRGGLVTGMRSGLFLILSFGLLGGLVGGGDIFVKHLLLRFILWIRHYAPLNYARFLDYCADRIFLRKVGGGYIFIHRLLMEHFASLTEEDIKRLAAASNRR